MAFSVVKTFLLAFSFFCYGTKAAVKPQFYCKMKSLHSSQSSVVQLPIYLVFFIQGICAPLPPTPWWHWNADPTDFFFWGCNSRQTSSWHFGFLWLIYLKWPEVSDHSQYTAVFWYFLFTAKEHTLRSHPPLKRKQDKTIEKPPPRRHPSMLMCHSWPQHMDRSLPQRTTTEGVTGGRQQARDCGNGHGGMKKKDHRASLEPSSAQTLLHLPYFKQTSNLTNSYNFQYL